MLTITLLITLLAIILNATHMFKRDNLDTISLSSDLLTAAKSGQVKVWAQGILARGANVAQVLQTSPKKLAPALLDGLQGDPELLLVRAPGRSWENVRLLKKLGIASNLQPPKDFDAAAPLAPGEVDVSPWVQPSGVVVLVFRQRFWSETAMIGVSNETLAKMFADTGPYTFALLNSHGQVLAHKDPVRVEKLENMSSLPIVKKLLTSDITRELEEFAIDGVPYLGAYSRVGVAGLSVMNTVSRAVALETGNSLIRRSVLIGTLVFLLAFMAAFMLVQSIISPVVMLETATREISAGDFSRRVAVRSRDEISELALSFNRMCEEISRRIRILARISESSLKARTITEPQALLDFAAELFTDLFEFSAAVGVYHERTEGKKGTACFSKKNWSDSGLLKVLQAKVSGLKSPTWVTEGAQGALICPILHKGEFWGCLILGDKKDTRPFSEEDRALAQTVLSVVSSEFENIAFSRALRTINAELEHRVEVRTRDLALANEQLEKKSAEILEAKKEVDDVMDNIQQGILTIDPHGTVNTEHSEYALEVFKNHKLAGSDLVALLLAGPENEGRASDMRDWFKTVFEQPENWEMLHDFGLRELQYVPRAEDGTPMEARDLKFEWRPIRKDEAIVKMMLVCVDVTEQKRLQSEMSKKDAEHHEQLEIIAQLVNHPKNVVEQFVSDFSRNLKSALEVLQGGIAGLNPETLMNLMRSLHTIKGCAKQFRLESIQQRAGMLETEVTGAIDRMPPEADRQVFFDKLVSEFAILDASLKRMIALYEKVAGGGGGGAGAVSAGGPVIQVPIEKIDGLIRKVFQGQGAISARAARKAVGWLLKAPVSSLFDRLDSLAQSVATELGREVDIIRVGDAVKLDSRVLSLLHDAFLHVVRNSLDHGGESPGERETRGRPPKISMHFTAEQLPEGAIRMEVSDDGKGINVEAVRKRAIERGLVDADVGAMLPAERVIQYVFAAGFSTRDTVSDLSGRGVGMEVLKNTVEKDLRGRVNLYSTEGEGTRVEIFFDADAMLEM